MKTHLCLIIVFISTLSFAQVLNYFPLQKNNYWSFVTTAQDTQTINITDTITHRNRLYYIFDNYRLEASLLRIDSNKVYVAVDTSEYIVYDFSANIGDTWSAPETHDPVLLGEITLQSKTDTIQTPLGTFDYCYRFHHFFGADYEYYEWFAPNTGLVKRDYIFFYFSQWTLVDYSIITSVKYNRSHQVDYILFPNYPNPFNPTTTINFSTPSNGFVKLSVLNTLGEEVSTLVNEFISAGSHEVTFNAENLASGIYFYRLKAGDFVETKKMVLLR